MTDPRRAAYILVGMARLVLSLLPLAVGVMPLAAAGPPAGPPPRATDPAPPPGWLETGTTRRWLAYGSYCWSTVCADMVPPSLRHDIPTIAVRVGARLRFHLGFAPTKLELVRGLATTPLRAASAVTFRVRARGTYVLLLSARATSGDASYLVRIRVARR